MFILAAIADRPDEFNSANAGNICGFRESLVT